MAENAFNEKIDYLVDARSEVMRRDAMAAELDKLRANQKKLSRQIAGEEKSIADEIAVTLKKRKQEISDSYDGRLDDNRARKKKITAKRDKKKAQRMNERIEHETRDIRNNSRELEAEMNTLFKKNKVPSFCASKLYFTLFMPHGLDEFLSMICLMLVYLGGFPALIMLLVKKTVLSSKNNVNVAFWCVLIAAIVLIFNLVVFFVIFNATKIKHSDILKQGRSLRDKIKANKRQIDAIRNSINKDKDESVYKLDAYDEKLANLDKEADVIGAKKQDALKSFEEDTRQLIIDEINGRRLEKLDTMKAEKKELEEKITKGEKMYSDKLLQITNKYAPYIGEEFCKVEKLNDLISIMEEEGLETVSEAISYYKGQKSSR